MNAITWIKTKSPLWRLVNQKSPTVKTLPISQNYIKEMRIKDSLKN